MFILPLVFGLIGAAVGATVAASVAQSVGTEDREKARYHRQVANDLTDKYTNLQQKYNEYTEKSQSEIDALTKQLAQSEAEKDLLYLIVRQQQVLQKLIFDIDENPTLLALEELKKAIHLTNACILELRKEFQVQEEFIQ
ncbi:MAG: hypothetical protein ACUVSQ_10645, partial [Pseudanabaenaceae cyanobacterium]